MKFYEFRPPHMVSPSSDRTPIQQRMITRSGKLYSLRTVERRICCMTFTRVVGVYNPDKTKSALQADFSFLDDEGALKASSTRSFLNNLDCSARSVNVFQNRLQKPFQTTLVRGEQTKRTYLVLCPLKANHRKDPWIHHDLDVQVFKIPSAFDKNGNPLPEATLLKRVESAIRKCNGIEDLERYLK